MPALDRKRLRECLESFSDSTGVPVTLYAPDGKILDEFLSENKFCKFFPLYKNPGECSENRLFSMQLSFDMGEAYIYYCPSGLVHIAVPVILDGKYQACAVAGPLSMGDADDRLLDRALNLNKTPDSSLTQIAFFAAQMRRFSPNQIQHLSNLLYSIVLYSHKNWQDYEEVNQRHRQQMDMGEQVWNRKPVVDSSSRTCAELSEQLARLLLEHNEAGAQACLDELMDELILVEGGNFDGIKLRVFEMYISLARKAMESGISQRKIFGRNDSLLNAFGGLEQLSDLIQWGRDMIHFYIHEVFAGLSPVSSITSQAISYIEDHHMEKLTLRDLSSHLFVSDSHFSKLFRQETGTSFNDHLNKTRIEHSIDLMWKTDLPLLEIASRVGFDDQSYFTKVFKRTTGKTPRQYKNSLAEEKKQKKEEDEP